MGAKEGFEEVFETYDSLKEICNDVRKRILINPTSSFAKKLISPEKIKRKKKKEDIVNDYFDSLNQKITDHCVMDIIATFEEIVFDRIDNAYGDIKRIVTDEYKKRYSKKEPAPFYISASLFIKNRGDIYNLSGVKKLLENRISKELFEQLTEIIEHRNWLSHGKRRDVGSESTLNINDIYAILAEILDEIY
ncbi:MAG: hypothetical protein GY795_26715 [Desulfobacterales bacterium]|nr:hypothetical protein [Desulfobacterales bacterium]